MERRIPEARYFWPMGPRGAVAALTLVMLLSPISSDALILRDSQLVHKVFPLPNETNRHRPQPFWKAFAYWLFRRSLDFLARLFNSRANIINSIVDAAASAFDRPTRTTTAHDSQHQNHQRQNPLHWLRIQPPAAGFQPQLGDPASDFSSPLRMCGC